MAMRRRAIYGDVGCYVLYGQAGAILKALEFRPTMTAVCALETARGVDHGVIVDDRRPSVEECAQ
jgi:hypothetical protein